VKYLARPAEMAALARAEPAMTGSRRLTQIQKLYSRIRMDRTTGLPGLKRNFKATSWRTLAGCAAKKSEFARGEIRNEGSLGK